MNATEQIEKNNGASPTLRKACLASCRKLIAQIDQAAFPLHEGVYYAFTCVPCRTTATTYQQT